MVGMQALRFLPYLLYRVLRRLHEDYRYEAYRQKYEISPGFRFNGYDILLYGDGRIILGEGSYIGRGSTIQAATGHKVSIGAGCAISHNVRIYTTSNIADQDFSGVKKVRMANVLIHDQVWLGANVFVNPGVEVGTNSVVGANSVLTRDVEPWTIVGGVPARLIRRKRLGKSGEGGSGSGEERYARREQGSREDRGDPGTGELYSPRLRDGGETA